MIIAPEHLGDAEKEIWNNIVPLLEGHIIELDTQIIALLCQNISLIHLANAEIKKEGVVVQTPSFHKKYNPYLRVRAAAEVTAIKIMRELGMTPRSRKTNRIVPKTTDALEDFL